MLFKSCIILTIVLCRFAVADELTKSLEELRTEFQPNNVRFAEVNERTKPLLLKYANDQEALKEIYRIRFDFAASRPSANTVSELSSEATNLLSFITYDEDRLYFMRVYQALFSRAGSLGAQREFERLCQRVTDPQQNMPAELVLFADARACTLYDQWKHPALMTHLKRFLKNADLSSPRDAQLAHGIIGTLLKTDHMLSQKYEVLLPLKESVLTSQSRSATEVVTHFAEAEMKLGKTKEALETINRLMEISPDDNSLPILKIRTLITAKDNVSAIEHAHSLIAGSPSAAEVFETHQILVDIALHQSDLNRALGHALAAYNVARSSNQLDESVGLISRLLAGKDGDLTRANQYLLFQVLGEAGFDGIAGTEDDLPTLHRLFAQYGDDHLKGNLLAQVPDLSVQLEYNVIRKCGYLLLNAGKPEEALNAFIRLYMLITEEATLVQQSEEDLPIALRAAAGRYYGLGDFHDDGTVARQMVLNVRQQQRISDDILKAAEEKFHAEIAQNGMNPATQVAGFRYASALMLSGKYDEAVAVAYSLFYASQDQQQMNQATMAVAAALRGRDLNNTAANAFTRYQRHGHDEQDAPRPVATQSQLPESHASWLRQQIPLLEQQQNYSDAAILYMLSIQPEQALSLLNRARSLIPYTADAVRRLNTTMMTALRTYHGVSFELDAFNDFIQFGPHGADGIPGTDDDRNDPLAEFTYEPFASATDALSASQTNVRFAIMEGDYETAVKALELFALLLTTEEQWKNSAPFYEEMLAGTTNQRARQTLQTHLARAIFASTGSPGALRFSENAALASMATRVNSSRFTTIRITSPELRPIKHVISVDHMIRLLDSVAQQRTRQGQTDPGFDKLYASFLAAPCSKNQVSAVMQKLLNAERRNQPQINYDDFTGNLLKLCHPSNREWVIMVSAQDAHQSGNRAVADKLIEQVDLAEADREVRRDIILMKVVNRFGEGKHKEAREVLVEWLDSFSDDDGADRALFLLGWSHLVEGDNEAAKKWFTNLVDNHPRSEFTQRARGFMQRL